MGNPPKQGVLCRGSCAAGHVTEVTADPGRTTWQGPCGHEGCELKVKARRVPRSADPPPGGTVEDGSIRVLRIDDYDEHTDPELGDGSVSPARPGDVEPASSDATEGEGAGPEGARDPVADDDNGGRWSRFKQRRRAAVASRPAGEWTHPLVP